MVKIDEISRTSTFAWSQDVIPLLATGTVAGTVDVNFNSSSSLELWDIFSATNSKEPILSASVENRFYGLEWSKPFEGRPKGLLAGAFENGVVEFWDADTLIKSKDLAKASVHKSTKHKGDVKSLQFNPLQPHILVTGGSHGEIFIWDTKTFAEPFAPGKAMTPMDEITSVAWNNSVSHIFASTSNGGFTSIWDLKSKREVLHLSYNGPLGRAEFSSVTWHPTQSRKLITASENDGCPLILTWDLRNTNEPEKILQGHTKGVLSLDWCKQDSDLLISSGKDNSTLLWNPITGEKLGEYPTTANWAFHTRFAPSSPDIFATASFDGKVTVQSLQDTSPPISTKVAADNDNDFWNELSTTDTQQPVFIKKQAPKWLKNPSAVSFGFGSKLVHVHNSTITISKFVINNNVEGSTSKLSKALTENDFKPIIEEKISSDSVDSTDKSDWNLLQKLSTQGKDKLFDNALLGGELETTSNGKDEKLAKESNRIDSDEPVDEKEDDEFFEKLVSSNGSTKSEVYVPEGKFKIFKSDTSDSDKQLIKLILSNKVEEAVSECLKLGKIVEALILALDAPQSVKDKVKNAYFKENDSSEVSRIIYNASSKNVLDIVSNADVEDWKEIATSISAFSADSNDFNSKIIELGDKILESDPSQRDNAIICYLSGNALDKVGAIWLKELPAYEESLLKSDKHDSIATPSDARFASLSNFVEKLSAYRAISNITGLLSGPSIEPIAKAVLEYSNLVASDGQFDLASSFLSLLPTDLEGLKTEKERIAKATGVSATKVAGNNTAGKTSGNYSRTRGAPAYNKYAGITSPTVNNVPLATKSSGYAPPQPTVGATPGARPPVGYPQQSSIPPTPVARQSSYAPQTAAIPHPSVPKIPPVAPAAIPSSPQAHNIYARQPAAPVAVSNPYAPSGAAASAPYNPYRPAGAPAGVIPPPNGPTVVSPPPVAPARNKYKEETDGWNDLPDTFKSQTAAPRRAAASVAAASPSPVPTAPQPSLSRKPTGVAQTAPPPPKGVSRTSSKAAVPTSASSTSAISSPHLGGQAQINRRYAPPAAPVADGISSTPPPVHPGLNGPATPSYSAPPKNPYAPSATSSPSSAKNPYAPPPPLQGANSFPAPPQPQLGGVSYNNGYGNAAPEPPRNPYAPPPSNPYAPSGAGSQGGIPAPPTAVPTPRFGGITAPPSHQQLPPTNLPTPPPPPSGISAPPPPRAAQSVPLPPPVAAKEEVKPSYPPGDRSHIPEETLPIYQTFSTVLENIEPQIPEKYADHYRDMATRLNTLFDKLNNQGLSQDAIQSLKGVCDALNAKDYQTASSLNIQFSTVHSEEIGVWHAGVKRLIKMAEAL